MDAYSFIPRKPLAAGPGGPIIEKLANINIDKGLTQLKLKIKELFGLFAYDEYIHIAALTRK